VSVDYKGVQGFGLVLDREQIVSILKNQGVKWDHDEPEYELQDLYASKVLVCGSAWSGKISFLYHCATTRDPETGDTKNDPEQVAALKRMIEENKLDTVLTYCEETYVY
jgi:hypothetical protein